MVKKIAIADEVKIVKREWPNTNATVAGVPQPVQHSCNHQSRGYSSSSNNNSNVLMAVAATSMGFGFGGGMFG